MDACEGTNRFASAIFRKGPGACRKSSDTLFRTGSPAQFFSSPGTNGHMATSSGALQTGIQVFLGLVIIGLSYFLYKSITGPYDRIERQQRMTEQTHQRMTNIRTALVDYERDSASYPDSLSLLTQHIREDSILSTRQDSVFGGTLNLDSLLYSPRSGERFQYALSDTGRVETYLLQDPASDDQIGTLTGDPTRQNAASWE